MIVPSPRWLLLCLLLGAGPSEESKTFGEIRAILLADWLKANLLAHARGLLAKTRSATEAARLEELIQRSEKLIRQPKSSPHDDHIHVSLK